MKRRIPSCQDVLICCQKCRKPVQRSIWTLADYRRCDLNHIFCEECIQREKLEDCPICDQPLEYKHIKTFDAVPLEDLE